MPIPNNETIPIAPKNHFGLFMRFDMLGNQPSSAVGAGVVEGKAGLVFSPGAVP